MNTSKYTIERKYIDVRHMVRPGTKMTSGTPKFIVAHDTGNAGADADDHYKYFQNQTDRTASAHVFIDDKKILEIIPTGTGNDPAEKAWHVLYNVTTDNDSFGDDANDIALGVELCYGGSINFDEAYKRFVWYLAYCCNKWGINPLSHIPSHKQLDPARKYDCDQALAKGGKTLKNLVADVASELKATTVTVADPTIVKLSGTTVTELNTKFVSVAWSASQKAGDEEGMTHFHNLAENLRASAAGTTRLPKSNAQEIIFRWLSPGWFKAKSAGSNALMAYYTDLADQLRKASGITTS